MLEDQEERLLPEEHIDSADAPVSSGNSIQTRPLLEGHQQDRASTIDINIDFEQSFEPKFPIESHSSFGKDILNGSQTTTAIKGGCYKRKSRFRGWRFGAACAATIAWTTLLFNFIFAIIIATKTPTEDGIATIYTGDCTVVRNWSVASHLAINILGSALLAGSNFLMQCLAAPTRRQLDIAHSKRKSLDIGIPSIRNIIFGRTPALRVVGWCVLCFSSLPIQFLYNSAIFATTASVNIANIVLAGPDITNRTSATEYMRSGPIPEYLRDKWTNNDQKYEFFCATSGMTYLTGCWDNATTNYCAQREPVQGRLGEWLDYSERSWKNMDTYYCAQEDYAKPFVYAPGASIINHTCTSYGTDRILINGSIKTLNCSSVDSFHKYFVSWVQNTNLERLSNKQCISEYATKYLTDRGDLVLVVKRSVETADLGFIASAQSIFGQKSTFDWMCDPRPLTEGQRSLQWRRWCVEQLEALKANSHNWTIGNVEIDHCLSVNIPQQCKLQAFLYILIAVIGCNLVKSVVMLWTLFAHQEAPLITIGDAVASFLTTPDRHASVSAGNWKPTSIPRKMRPLRSTPRRWSAALGTARWLWMSAMFVAALIVLSWSLGSGVRNLEPQGGSAFSRGWSSIDADAFISFLPNKFTLVLGDEWTGTSNLLAVVLFVNFPQVVCSAVYFAFNYILTEMLLSYQWSQYYLEKRPLRVSDPRGLQKSTYFLTVPYRYSAPLLVASIFLHWLISQCLFLARIEWTRTDASSAAIQFDNPAWSAAVYSCLPILVTIIWASAMLIALLALARRKLPGKMPLPGSNSLEIARMCQRPDGDGDAAYLPVSWGELEHASVTDDCICCFTSHPVHPPCSVATCELPPPPRYRWIRSLGYSRKKGLSEENEFELNTTNHLDLYEGT